MSDVAVDWLAQEVRDLLGTSSVGLYEFIWLLRGRQPQVRSADTHRIAKEALQELLSDGDGRLVRLTWPSQISLGDVDPDSLRQSDWDDPRQGEPYVAMAL